MDWTRSLPDEFFLLAHDDYTGAPLINKRVLSIGVAGAVLLELLITRQISIISGDRVCLVEPAAQPGPGSGGWPAEAHTDSPAEVLTLHEIAGQRGPKQARAWVEYLGESVHRSVSRHLVGRDVVRRVSAGIVRRTDRYVAVDPLVACHGRVSLRYIVDHGLVPDERTASLAGLVLVTGLHAIVADGANQETLPGLRKVGGVLSRDLATVVAAVDKALRAIVLVPSR